MGKLRPCVPHCKEGGTSSVPTLRGQSRQQEFENFTANPASVQIRAIIKQPATSQGFQIRILSTYLIFLAS